MWKEFQMRNRTGVKVPKDIENHLRETRPRWLGHLERMDGKRAREERVLGHMKRGR